MPKHNPNSYSYLDDNGAAVSKSALEWYWRTLAFFSSWFILAGFITFSPLLDTDSSVYRVTRPVLFAVSITFLAVGFLSSAVVFLVCKDWRMRFDIIALPGLTSSLLGLFAILFPLGISTTFTISGSAGLTAILVGTLAIATYICLIGLAYYKSQRSASSLQPNNRVSLQHLAPSSASNDPASQDPTKSTAYVGATARPPPIPYGLASYGEAPVTIVTGPPLPPEEEETREQMSRLLRRRSASQLLYDDGTSVAARNRASQQSLRSTYHLEWPIVDDDDAGASPLTGVEPRSFVPAARDEQRGRTELDLPPHVREYYFSDGRGGGERRGRASSSVSLLPSAQPSPALPEGTLAAGEGTERGFVVSPMATPRLADKGKGRMRSLSRESRRREIERGSDEV